jgi:hypothetical protein
MIFESIFFRTVKNRNLFWKNQIHYFEEQLCTSSLDFYFWNICTDQAHIYGASSTFHLEPTTHSWLYEFLGGSKITWHSPFNLDSYNATQLSSLKACCHQQKAGHVFLIRADQLVYRPVKRRQGQRIYLQLSSLYGGGVMHDRVNHKEIYWQRLTSADNLFGTTPSLTNF